LGKDDDTDGSTREEFGPNACVLSPPNAPIPPSSRATSRHLRRTTQQSNNTRVTTTAMGSWYAARSLAEIDLVMVTELRVHHRRATLLSCCSCSRWRRNRGSSSSNPPIHRVSAPIHRLQRSPLRNRERSDAGGRMRGYSPRSRRLRTTVQGGGGCDDDAGAVQLFLPSDHSSCLRRSEIRDEE
jgi:hypothetical protein